MSEVPNNEGTTGPDELNSVLKLHTSPTALKISDQSQLQHSVTQSDISALCFPPSTNEKCAQLRNSGAVEDGGVALPEGEQSISLDQLDRDAFPSTSSAQAFLYSGPNHSSALDKPLSQDLSAKELKSRRRTLAPDELSNVTLQNKEQDYEVFRKHFRRIGEQVSPLNPLSEYGEENHRHANPSIDLNDIMDVQLASTANHAKDPYVLNINVVVPKQYTQQNIPINVNIIENSNNSSAESVTSRRDSSMTSSGTQGFEDNMEHARNSTFMSEPGDTEQNLQLVHVEKNTNFQSAAPGKLHHMSRSDEISPQDAEVHLNETLPVAVKTEPLDIEKETTKPGTSKPSTSKPRNTAKGAQPSKSKVAKDPVEKKASSKKTLPAPKPKENVKINKETATKPGAKEGTRKKNVAKKSEATKRVMDKPAANNGADKKQKTKREASKQVDAQKQPKEKSKKACKTEQGAQKVIGKSKERNKHAPLNKKTKRNSCKQPKLVCKLSQQRRSESESSSECSLCRGKYCGRSDYECNCASSESSSCSCSSCQNCSSSSDYDSSDS